MRPPTRVDVGVGKQCHVTVERSKKAVFVKNGSFVAFLMLVLVFLCSTSTR